MKTADAIWMCLSEGMDELFEMVRFERTEQSYDIWLDERRNCLMKTIVIQIS